MRGTVGLKPLFRFPRIRWMYLVFSGVLRAVGRVAEANGIWAIGI
jgi:hypothetical protein